MYKLDSGLKKQTKTLSLATRSDNKLNRLRQALPERLLADAGWLEAHGYSSALRSHYSEDDAAER